MPNRMRRVRTAEMNQMVGENDRISSFINSLDPGNLPFLDELERKALEDQVPIIRKDTQALLKFLMAQSRPKNIFSAFNGRLYRCGHKDYNYREI